jgi:hypothetical protein
MISRVACMGSDVIKGLELPKNVINHQKNRVDHIIRLHEKKTIKPKINKLEKYFQRKDILPLILQQRDDIFSYKQPKYIIFDSFSELTDQRFRHKNDGWEFFSNYADILHGDDFNNTFECLGLLSIDEIEKYYDILFSLLNQTYNNVPIIFLHFPTILDKREKFNLRGKGILNSIDQLSYRIENLYSFDVPETIVGWPKSKVSIGLEDFPYHYNSETYQYLIELVSSKLYKQR